MLILERDFNSSVVRLKELLPTTEQADLLHFNSSVVRLKANVLIPKSTPTAISIPVWYD